MKKIAVSLLCMHITMALLAQQPALNYQQVFSPKSTVEITKPLPNVVKWQDDTHVLLAERVGAKMQQQLLDIKTGSLTPVESTEKSTPQKDVAIPKEAKNFTYSTNEQLAAYTLNNNLYVMQLANEKTTQVTFDGSKNIKNGYASWVYFEEILGRASRYKAFWISNDNQHIAFMRFDDSAVPVYPLYVNTGQHGYLEQEQYPKVGDKNPNVKMGIYHVGSNTITWADFNEQEDQYFGMPYWTPNHQLWVQWMNRGQDHLVIYNIDLQTGAKTPVYDEKQSTWIDLDDNDRIEFLQDSKQCIIKSDYTGWKHLYLYDMNGKLVNAITAGAFTVGSIIKIDEKNKQVFYLARKENSARWDLYATSFDGKKTNRLSFGAYSFSNVSIAPNNKYYIATYSNITTPATTAIIDMKGNVVKELGNNKGTDFANYTLPKKELIRVKSHDDLFDLPVTITYPINFDANKKYPVLVSVYGGPDAGRVYDMYRMLPTEIWWAQEGLVQVEIDNRSSGHFGKKGMNFIHRQLGLYEIQDFMTVGKWLKSQSWMDTSKLCITGGSFGGYMTCMALTYGAAVFNYGVANSSVTDWSLYDSHYTERFMDQPSENPDGYQKTAVMTYANQYKGLLRIVHGTSDDNVHPQNSMQLINKLEDLKKHFELMIYPGERHGISGAKGLHNRTEAYLFYYNHLLNKPMPKEFWQ